MKYAQNSFGIFHITYTHVPIRNYELYQEENNFTGKQFLDNQEQTYLMINHTKIILYNLPSLQYSSI